MTESGCHDWKQLAQAARDETDPKKFMDLVEQLNRALEEQTKGRSIRPSNPVA
jgi:hypothetical protein